MDLLLASTFAVIAGAGLSRLTRIFGLLLASAALALVAAVQGRISGYSTLATVGAIVLLLTLLQLGFLAGAALRTSRGSSRAARQAAADAQSGMVAAITPRAASD